MALPQQNRIRRARDFEAIFKEGRSASGTFLFIKSIPAKSGTPRFAFVVSSKVARTAVYRNRIRRVLAAAAREIAPRLPKARDVVVVVTKKTDAKTLREDFLNTLKKSGIT